MKLDSVQVSMWAQILELGPSQHKIQLCWHNEVEPFWIKHGEIISIESIRKGSSVYITADDPARVYRVESILTPEHSKSVLDPKYTMLVHKDGSIRAEFSDKLTRSVRSWDEQ